MTITAVGHDVEVEAEEGARKHGANTADELAVASERSGSHPTNTPLPWIGALRNPRVGPMVALDDRGYLVPLCTAGDLLRGCRYFWRASQD